MAYSNNPELPKVRGQAVELVRRGWSTRMVARHLGYTHSAVVKWVAKARVRGYGAIPTRSSRPKHHPRALSREVVSAIIHERVGRRRCAEHVYHALKKQGVMVSLSSVKRTLDRSLLLKKRSPWKRRHDFTPRPVAVSPGALLELDTIHIIAPDGSRIYIYTIIDLFSRWAYAEVVEKIGAVPSGKFVRRAQKQATFRFALVQTDHGSEFSTWFTHALWSMDIRHRHSRVRQKDDQAHIERFNRTIQEECLDRTAHTIRDFRAAIKQYLPYYNTERTHMGINYQTPSELVPSY
ncbi:MAG: integrase core domain-containing protein [bacterium]|nr:integrase core domain-containing protein [bacterium]